MNPTTSFLCPISGEAVAIFLRSAPEWEIRLTPTAWLAISGEPLADFNIAMVDVGPQADEQLRAFGQVLRQRNLPALILLTDAVADQLAPTVSALGMQLAGKLPLMGRWADDRSASGAYHVMRVEGEREFSAAQQLITSAFSFPVEAVRRVLRPAMLDGPGLAMFVAWDGEAPMSTVTTVQAGRVVGIWAMATPPERQRKGAGRAVLEHALAYHRDRGVEFFYLWATEAGLRLYEHTGFRTIAQLTVWASGHSVQVIGH